VGEFNLEKIAEFSNGEWISIPVVRGGVQLVKKKSILKGDYFNSRGAWGSSTRI